MFRVYRLRDENNRKIYEALKRMFKVMRFKVENS